VQKFCIRPFFGLCVTGGAPGCKISNLGSCSRRTGFKVCILVQSQLISGWRSLKQALAVPPLDGVVLCKTMERLVARKKGAPAAGPHATQY
jgi:hypothetical protein